MVRAKLQFFKIQNYSLALFIFTCFDKSFLLRKGKCVSFDIFFPLSLAHAIN